MPVKKRRNKRSDSVELTKDERKALKAYRAKFDTEVGCAISLGLDRMVLNRILFTGSGLAETIEKIRTKLNSVD